MDISARKLLLLMLIAISCKGTSFTVTLLQPSQVPTSKDAFVRFELKNYGANVPRVIGSNVILSSISDFTPNGSGVVTGNIQGNDTISPANTYYSVGFFKGGTRFYTCDMIISGSSQDLDNTSCLQTGTPPVPFTSCVICPANHTTSCPVNQIMTGLDSSGNAICIPIDIPEKATTCPIGQFMTGEDLNGNAICSTPSISSVSEPVYSMAMSCQQSPQPYFIGANLKADGNQTHPIPSANNLFNDPVIDYSTLTAINVNTPDTTYSNCHGIWGTASASSDGFAEIKDTFPFNDTQPFDMTFYTRLVSTTNVRFWVGGTCCLSTGFGATDGTADNPATYTSNTYIFRYSPGTGKPGDPGAGDTTYKCLLVANGGALQTANSGITPDTNWHHFSVFYDKTNVTWKIDGVQVCQMAATFTQGNIVGWYESITSWTSNKSFEWANIFAHNTPKVGP